MDSINSLLLIHFGLTDIFTVDLCDWLTGYLELSYPKPLDQSINVTVRTIHICHRIVHEQISLGLGGASGPRHHVACSQSNLTQGNFHMEVSIDNLTIW